MTGPIPLLPKRTPGRPCGALVLADAPESA